MEADLITDLTKALFSMENKTPGLDGLPKEIYVTSWDQVQVPMLNMYKESLQKGTLPLSMRTGVISLLFKKGNKSDLKNWRPLSLLGVDTKILSKVPFFRLQKVINQLIAKEQTCVIPGRKITDSLALVRDAFGNVFIWHQLPD